MVPQFRADCTPESEECRSDLVNTEPDRACETVVLLLRHYSHFQEVIFARTLSERQAKHVATDPHAERYELLETIDGNLFQAGEARRTMELNVIATVAEKAPTATPGTPSRLGLLIERAFARLQELVDAIIDRALGRDRPAKRVVETPAVETSPPSGVSLEQVDA